ncbi:bifunctional diguanylate cyclase/phosphodiesterase [Paucibacter sp. KCTC 42545]|uniref:bifunctional diguanylate cyclase/phosphodiesterase n=1 Tax=Paucibacter sp. KCTC 42545 TaxID=1768242 RepID=UPI000733AA86|nr:EAL domain-containing protein [Paucibacter sp. KCTC 42545]ALT77822.1 hypothetical protein AT984_12160 [Paucibacter sp. KCTC 42545]
MTHLDGKASKISAQANPRLCAVLGGALLALAYALSAALARQWLTRRVGSSGATLLLWPPMTVALLGFHAWGRQAWPGLLAGVALSQALSLAAQPSLALASGGLIQHAGAELLQLLGAAAARAAWHGFDFSTPMGSRRDLLLFALFGLVLGPLLSSVAANLWGAALPGAAGFDWQLLSMDWGAQATGVMMLAPALLSLSTFAKPAQSDATDAPATALPESALALAAQSLSSAAATGLAAWVFLGEFGLQAAGKVVQASASAATPWLFASALLLGLSTLGPTNRLASFTALLINAIALLATSLGLGPFALTSGDAALWSLWGFIASMAALPLLTDSLKTLQQQRQQRWLQTLKHANLAQAEWRLGRQGARLLSASELWRDVLGPHMGPAQSHTMWLEAVHPLDKERARQTLSEMQAPAGADSSQITLRLLAHGKTWRWFDLSAQVLARRGQGAQRGQALHLQCTLNDVDWRHTAEERQRMSISLFQHLHEGLLVTDMNNRVLDVNPSYCEMLGSTRDVLVGQSATPLTPLTLRRSGLSPEALQQALHTQGFWQAQVQTERADGSPCQLQLTVSTIPEPDGPLRYRVVTVSDMTRTVQQQAALEQQSRFDTLTQLPNHDEFMQRLQSGLQQAEAEGFRLSICRVDLDQFKHINSRYGSQTADALLKQVAQRLRAALRSAPQWSDTVARLSGDEFALLLRSSGADEAQLALERLLKVLTQPYRLERQPDPAGGNTEALQLALTASIGATLFPQDNSDAETLLRHAGHALFRVKHSGRNGYQMFDTAKHLRDEASLIALTRVQQALDAGELRLYYHPKVDVQTGQVQGMEALLRWLHPERGLLPPLHFLPLIEATGLAAQVGDWVIAQALKQSAQWLAQGLSLSVSVNVTALQLQSPDFSARLLELIKRHPEPVAQHLCLEVLESAALADVDATYTLIQQCRTYGVRFALDDFGTGYSTLTYLKRLPVDELKIDRSFVHNLLVDAQDRALVEGVISLAQTFGCSVVAEGVESVAHASALLSMGCVLGQGNGIAHAMPAEEVPDWVRGFSKSRWAAQAIGHVPGLA